MRPVPLTQRPLAFDAMVFGELVHDLLRRTVDLLEPRPGLVCASRDQIEQALHQAVEAVREAWPLVRAVPPPHLWTHALEEGARRSLRALTVDESFQAGTQSWTEFSFGTAETDAREGPWPANQAVVVGSRQLQLSGRIDRVDVAAGGMAIRLSDYKTGELPRNADRVVLDRGREVQRVLYAIAARQLCPDTRQLSSRLVYLHEDVQPFALRDPILAEAATELVRYLDTACDLLSAGKACPGPDGQERYNDLRLALPADSYAYFRCKAAAFAALHRDMAPLWSKP
jgi:ATP-dependent helicase/DNAse subunit B